MTTSVEDKLLNMQQQQEIDNLKFEIKDLEEKLETIKVRRQEDKLKLKEYEKAKIQIQQVSGMISELIRVLHRPFLTGCSACPMVP
jgi:dynactin 1